MTAILEIITILYAASGIVSTAGYFPTIKDLAQKKESANIHSYVIWTITMLVSFLYALFVISDLLLEIVTGLNFVSCAIILILSVRLKAKLNS